MHQAKRCGTDNCRKYYWYNYVWLNRKKIVCVSLEQIDILFVTNSVGFEKSFLKHHEYLHFRAHVSSAAVIYTVLQIHKKTKEKFPLNVDYFTTLYRDARFLLLAMREFGMKEEIEIGDEISDIAL